MNMDALIIPVWEDSKMDTILISEIVITGTMMIKMVFD